MIENELPHLNGPKSQGDRQSQQGRGHDQMHAARCLPAPVRGRAWTGAGSPHSPPALAKPATLNEKIESPAVALIGPYKQVAGERQECRCHERSVAAVISALPSPQGGKDHETGYRHNQTFAAPLIRANAIFDDGRRTAMLCAPSTSVLPPVPWRRLSPVHEICREEDKPPRTQQEA